MATYYWVGGSGTWDASNATNWSLTSGGTGGLAGAPTTNDDVYFDFGSGTPTVTIGAGAACNDFIDVVGFTYTAGASPSLRIGGNWVTAQNAPTFSTSIPVTFTQNSLSGSNQTILRPRIVNWAGNSITLGAVTLEYSTSGGPMGGVGIQFQCPMGSATLTMSSLAFTNRNMQAAGQFLYVFANTFAIGSSGISFGSPAPIPLSIIGMPMGGSSQTTLTMSGSVSNYTYVNWANFTTSSSAFSSGSSRSNAIGNLGNNTGFSFPTPTTWYYVGGNGAVYPMGGSKWSTTSGGGTSANPVLPHDTFIFDNNSGSAGTTVDNRSGFILGSVNASTRTTSMSFTGNWLINTDFNLGSNISFAASSSASLMSMAGGMPAPTRTFTASNSSHQAAINFVSGQWNFGSAVTTTNSAVMYSANINASTYTFTTSTLTYSATTVPLGFVPATVWSMGGGSAAFRGGAVTLTGSSIVLDSSNSNWFGSGASSVYTCTITNTGSSNIAVNTNSSAYTGYSFRFSGGTYPLTFLFNNNDTCAGVDFTGFNGTWSGPSSNATIYGSLTLSSGMTLTGSSTLNISSMLGSVSINTAGKSIPHYMSISGSNTVTLASAVTITNTSGWISYALLDMAGFSMTTPSFSHTNATLNSIGNITITGTGGFSSSATTITGTGVVTLPNANCTVSNANLAAPTFVFPSSGSNTFSISGSFKDLTFTGGTHAFNATGTVSIRDSLTLVSGMTASGGVAVQMAPTTGSTATVTTAGVTLSFSSFSANGSVTGTTRFLDAVTMTGQLRCQAGTLDLNGQTVTAGTAAWSGGSVSMNGSTLVVTGSGASAFTGSSTFAMNDTTEGVIRMTSASAKTFAGGGKRYYARLDQGGAGTLTTTGSGNRFGDIAKSHAGAATVIFPASVTTTFDKWSGSGTAGNLMTIQSSSSGTRATLSYAGSGVVSADYLSVRDISGSPTNTWYVGANSTNVSNNLNIIFTAAPALSGLMMMFL